MPDLTDPDDFCRRCGGRGGANEPTERGTLMWEPCVYCRGTGKRTVRVDEREAS